MEDDEENGDNVVEWQAEKFRCKGMSSREKERAEEREIKIERKEQHDGETESEQ